MNNADNTDMKIIKQASNAWLRLAASAGRIDMVIYMVEQRDADIHAKDDRGRSALDIARQNGHEEIIEYLIAHGATNKE